MVLENDIRYYGMSNLLAYPEFRNIDCIQTIFNILEDRDFLINLVSRYSSSGVTLLIGRELEIENMSECAVAFVKVPLTGGDHAYINMIGSKRMDYSKVLPVLNEVKKSLETSTIGWN